MPFKKFPLIFIIIIALLFSFLVSAKSLDSSIIISEVMYAPGKCDDLVCEWVELFNPTNHSVNLSKWNISDLVNEDEITCCKFLPDCSMIIGSNSYTLIVDQDSEFNSNYETNASILCVDDKAIGNSLSNKEDTINLINALSKKEDTFSYAKNQGGYKNNKTVERRSDGTLSESLFDGGTPGRKNSIWNLSTEYSFLIITEILPDPFGEDSAFKPGGEWVELFNTGKKDIDLKGLILRDAKGKLPIAHNKINGDSTIICGGCYKTVYRSKDSDFSLNRDYDEVSLFSEDNLLNTISYSGSTEGMSWSLVNNEWVQTEPTPEKENVYQESCDWKVEIEIDNTIKRRDNFSFSVIANREVGFARNITLLGKIEDYDGKTIKEYISLNNKPVTTKFTKKYSPKLKEGVYQLSFWFDNLSCNDKHLEDNKATKLLAINPVYNKNESSIFIEKVYLGSDDEAEWGDQFTVKLNVYKGDETKQSVQLWAEKDGEKVSKTTSFNIVDNFKEYLLTLPVQLLPNCNEKVSSGSAKLVLEAFGLHSENFFIINGVDKDICRDYLDYVKEVKRSEKKKFSLNFVDLPVSVNPGQILRLQVQLINDDKNNVYFVWPYLYRGNKCYSCENSERDYLTQSINLADNEIKVVDFLLKVDEGIVEGAYNLKIMYQKKGLKTAKSITKEIYVKEEEVKEEVIIEKNQSLELFSVDGSLGESQIFPERILDTNYGKRKNDGFGIVVYESSSVKAKKLIPTLLMITFGLLCLILISKKPASSRID